ncbi:MAG: aldo/keto reductase [Myxococcota bacterium]|nr:aldo/keto reductase [Myxococcota bacterium]
MQTTRLGTHGPIVSAVGLGSLALGRSGPFAASGDDEGIGTIRAAIERGVTLLDTADFYGNGESELLVARAILGRRDQLLLSVKFGVMRGPNGQMLGLDARPSAVKNFAAYSLKRLGVEVIDVYRPARLDPDVPIEDTVGAIAELIQAGYVRYVGLSEVGAETIRRAHAVHPIADVQMEYSLATRSPEDKIFPVLRELGIGATLFGVLGRGLLSGSTPTGPKDVRAHLPRFSGEAGKENAALVEKLRQFAVKVGRSPAQVCLAWALAEQPGFVPIAGARTPAQLDLLDAVERPLSAAEKAELEALLPKGAFQGSRYPEAQMSSLDSER